MVSTASVSLKAQNKNQATAEGDSTAPAKIIDAFGQSQPTKHVKAQAPTAGKRFEELYNLGKQNQQKNKTDKSKEDYEWEKNKDELTF
jgi:hypothetical protein